MAVSKKKTKARAAPKRAAQAPLAAALAEAGWREADQSLAQALADAAEVSAAAKSKSAARLADAVTMLTQSLNIAARRRGLAAFGDVGARVNFEAKRHHFIGPGRPTKIVRIAASGVERAGEVLVKARVRAVRPRKRA